MINLISKLEIQILNLFGLTNLVQKYLRNMQMQFLILTLADHKLKNTFSSLFLLAGHLATQNLIVNSVMKMKIAITNIIFLTVRLLKKL